MSIHTRRYFIGLPIKEGQLTVWQESIKPTLEESSVKRWTHRCDGHITLHFLGQLKLPEVESLTSALTVFFEKSHLRILQLKAHTLSQFPASKPKVLATLIESCDDLTELYKEIAVVLKQVSLTVENRLYHPHVTLARLYQKDYEGFQEILLDKAVVACSSVCLYESTRSTTGARYRVSHQWDLKPK